MCGRNKDGAAAVAQCLADAVRDFFGDHDAEFSGDEIHRYFDLRQQLAISDVSPVNPAGQRVVELPDKAARLPLYGVDRQMLHDAGQYRRLIRDEAKMTARRDEIRIELPCTRLKASVSGSIGKSKS